MEIQTNLFGVGQPPSVSRFKSVKFKGPDIEPFDAERLGKQLQRVYHATKGGQWMTLAAIEEITNDPQASISARLRGLRQWFNVERKRSKPKSGLWVYRVVSK